MQVPDLEQVQVLVQFCNRMSEPHVRVKILGTLGCLAQHPTSTVANLVRRFCHYQAYMSKFML
jgi:hypothetical protein